MPSHLVPPGLLFPTEVSVLSARRRDIGEHGRLPNQFTLPKLGGIDGLSFWAEFAMAWSDDGIYFQVEVQHPHPTILTERVRPPIDLLRLWLDVRGSPNIHRATRYCHCFRLRLASKTAGQWVPQVELEPISRAREFPKPIDDIKLSARIERSPAGYRVLVDFPSAALTGYAPREFPNASFFVKAYDPDLGEQSWMYGNEFDYVHDPSLWTRIRFQPSDSK